MEHNYLNGLHPLDPEIGFDELSAPGTGGGTYINGSLQGAHLVGPNRIDPGELDPDACHLCGKPEDHSRRIVVKLCRKCERPVCGDCADFDYEGEPGQYACSQWQCKGECLPEEESTYRIKAARVDELDARFAKIAKRAKKLGCIPPTYEILSTEDVPVKKRVGNTAKWESTGAVIRWHTVRLVGERPILAGYKFLATLEHASEVGLIVRTVPGENCPARYRTADLTNCDHCHIKIRTRTETFVVEEEATGLFKQVGRNCIADFLGGVEPKSVLWLMQVLSECGDLLTAAGGDDEGGNAAANRRGMLFEMVHVLALTSALCRNFGWVPRGKAAEWEKWATADRAVTFVFDRDDAMFKDKHGRVDYDEKAKYQTTAQDLEVAELALDWARNLAETQGDTLNDYLHNLTTLSKAGAVQSNHFGLACSIVSSYQREQERLSGIVREAKRTVNSVHFGKVGKRADFNLTVTRYTTYQGDWGVRHIFGFEDADGNAAVWFGTNDGGMEREKTYRVKATVKDHGDYKGTKQTVLTRLKMVSEVTA